MLDTITQHRRTAVALVAAAAVAVAALLPGTWGTAVAQTAGEVQVTFTVDGQQHTSILTDEGLSIEIPPGATITGMNVFVADGTSILGDLQARTNAITALADLLGVSSGNLNAALVGSAQATQSADGTRLLRGFVRVGFTVPSNASLLSGRDAFVMDARALTQHHVRAFQVSPPTDLGVTATMSLFVSAEAVADVGGDMSRIQVFYLNEFTGEPEPVTMLPSPGPGQVAFEWTREGDYVIMTRLLVPLPPLVLDAEPAPQAVPIPADTGMGEVAGNTAANTAAYLALAGVLAALVGIGGVGARLAVRRRRA
jgi:hypothetical protein